MPESCDNSGRLLGGDDVHERAERIKEGQRIRAEVARLAEASVPADGTIVFIQDHLGHSQTIEWEADRGQDAVRFYFSEGDYVEVSREGDHLRIRGAGGVSVGVLGFRSDGSNVLKAWILE